MIVALLAGLQSRNNAILRLVMIIAKERMSESPSALVQTAYKSIFTEANLMIVSLTKPKG